MKLNFKEEVIDYNNAAGFSPSGSLTPRNNKSKQGFSFEKGEMDDGTIAGYVYTYSNEQLKAEGQSLAEIKHYSIDPVRAKTSVEEFNNELLKKLVSKTTKPQITQSSSKKSGTYKADDDKKLLHECETILIEKALSENERVILVDIFARNDDGTIKLQGENPETHTVILCKGNEGKILVIDPNNSSFSSHLATQYNKGAGLEVAPSLCKIYQPVNKDSIGTSINSSRDCIDIAIKLAYKLSALDSEKIGFKSNSPEIFTTHEMKDIVKDISNNSKYDDGIDELVRNEQGFLMIPARLKQVTQDGYGKDFYDNEIKVVKQLELKKRAIIKKIIDVTDKPEKTLENFTKEKLNKESSFETYTKSRESYKNDVITYYNKCYEDNIKLAKDGSSLFNFSLSDHTKELTDKFLECTGEVSFDSYMEV
jgi:hypothetical protein